MKSASSFPAAARQCEIAELRQRLQQQSRQLQEMSDELAALRSALAQRKVVERAKGLLMAHRQLTEDEAYRALRQMAMNHNRRIVDVAEAVLSLAEVLPPGPT